METESVFKALGQFTSSDICDALVRLDVPYGGYLQGLTMFSPERQTGSVKVFGPAYTVQLVLENDTNAPSPSVHFVDAIPKNSVVYIKQPAGTFVGVWGGLMSTRAKKLGAQGVVVDGSFRDIMEHKDLGFPVFAKGFSIVGSKGFTRASAINVPVEFTSENQKHALIINPGDFIVGDCDGVAVIPVSAAERCLALCQQRADIDSKTRECLNNGEAFGPTVARLRK